VAPYAIAGATQILLISIPQAGFFGLLDFLVYICSGGSPWHSRITPNPLLAGYFVFIDFDGAC